MKYQLQGSRWGFMSKFNHSSWLHSRVLQLNGDQTHQLYQHLTWSECHLSPSGTPYSFLLQLKTDLASFKLRCWNWKWAKNLSWPSRRVREYTERWGMCISVTLPPPQKYKEREEKAVYSVWLLNKGNSFLVWFMNWTSRQFQVRNFPEIIKHSPFTRRSVWF